ncbi:MAG: hypothetical protein JO261_15700 [Alphaproteobacteria bacterium]|nr:hypothetical protein [Alphaproteobacteria bacterium]MBV9695137.1 hypothetical protein [Alphaproteobacteria bacterium]
MPTTPIDVNQLIANLKTVASGIIQQDVTTIEGYSERQLAAMAQQAKWIAAATLSGDLSTEMRDYFLQTLKDSAINFANTLKGLVVVTVEKVWNALVGALWTAISNAIGAALPSGGGTGTTTGAT